MKTTFITYGFVTDAGGRLVGVVAMRDLLFAGRDQRLDEIMLRDPFSLRPDMPLVEAMRHGRDAPLPGLPRVRRRGPPRRHRARADALRGAGLEISAQAGAMVGVEKEERARDAAGRAASASATRGCSSTCSPPSSPPRSSGVFQGTIDRLVVLAVFLPVLAGQSGNTGCQALAVTLRGLTLGELRPGARAGW